jgi:hypothetical protein
MLRDEALRAEEAETSKDESWDAFRSTPDILSLIY